MATPVYIVAGQSNAYSLNGGNGGASVASAFTALTGSRDVIVAAVHEAGAPLTWGRAGPDWYSKDEMFDQLVATIKQALATPDTYLANILWIQGEGDTWSFARATEYAARLIDLVGRLHGELHPLEAQTDGFRFTVLALSANTPAAANQSNWDTIRTQQLGLDHPRIDVVDADQATLGTGKALDLFQPDGLHYAASANAPILQALLDGSALRLDGTMGPDRLTGLAGRDILRGGAGDDVLSGQGAADYLRGWTGNDTLSGGSGNDTLTGDLGVDRLTGGSGADCFVFCTTRDTTGDTITDFRPGLDRIALSGIDANDALAGDQAFHWLGLSAFDGTAGALRYARTAEGAQVLLDLNGDRAADALILLSAVSTLTATDFLL